jgi:hypothetical protein
VDTRVYVLGIKLPGRGFDHSRALSAEVTVITATILPLFLNAFVPWKGVVLPIYLYL